MASTSTVKRSCAGEKTPNWLELPHELMTNILERLSDAEILNSAVKVCTKWRKIGRDPAMWKVINMRKPVDADYDIPALTKQAVHLSAGELIDISLEGFGVNFTDDLLHNILLRSSKLKSLCLTNCYSISNNGLIRALKEVPQLEKLDISFNSWTTYVLMVPNCPQLKSFKLDKECIYGDNESDVDAFAIAKNMPELRHLELYGNSMTKTGLQAILDGCPHLESLDIRTCYKIDIHGNEEKLYVERFKSFKGPDASIENCGFPPRTLDYNVSDDYGGPYFDFSNHSSDVDPSSFLDYDEYLDYYYELQ